ncbi:MAG TPA: amino acid racemase [Anaerolineaceae bacterium]|jgi:aspartate racemase|nr:amino acid racemase [Anaerolineaceae bacterium]
MKTAGVIGGFGPQTTAKFYEEVFFACQRLNSVVKPHILISSVPLPFWIEETALLKNEGVEDYLPYLTKEAQRLEKAGADFIVMPCNSLHVHIDALCASVQLPVLSILEETAQFLVQQNIHRIGILSTAITASHFLYKNALAKYGIECLHPKQDQQEFLNAIVLRLVNGITDNHDREVLHAIMQTLTGVDCILLACTDLQLVELHYPTLPIFDTLQILVNSTVRELLA